MSCPKDESASLFMETYTGFILGLRLEAESIKGIVLTRAFVLLAIVSPTKLFTHSTICGLDLKFSDNS